MGIDLNIDYYSMLNLKSGASDVEIKKQFHSMAKMFHPDITQG